MTIKQVLPINQPKRPFGVFVVHLKNELVDGLVNVHAADMDLGETFGFGVAGDDDDLRGGRGGWHG